MGASIDLPAEEESDNIVSMTNFKRAEVKRWYKVFMKNHPDGKLEREQFCELFGRLFTSGLLANHIFDTIDLNRDGHVSFRELMLHLSITMKGSAQEKLEWAFDVYDLDSNGEITLDEMRHVLLFIRDNVSAAAVADQMSDESHDEKIAEIFKVVDTDADGVLSRDEFVEGMKLYPAFLNMMKVHATATTAKKTEKKQRRDVCMRNRSALGNDHWKCKLTCKHGALVDSGVGNLG